LYVRRLPDGGSAEASGGREKGPLFIDGKRADRRVPYLLGRKNGAGVRREYGTVEIDSGTDKDLGDAKIKERIGKRGMGQDRR